MTLQFYDSELLQATQFHLSHAEMYSHVLSIYCCCRRRRRPC